MARIELDTRLEDGVAVIALSGELDIAATAALEDALHAAAEAPATLGIVIDLSGLEFMDSSGLRAIAMAHQRLDGQGVRFALVRGGDPVHRVFEITRMTERLPWVDEPADLLQDAEDRT
jgi:anti-sigma B factor antagonist